MSKAGQIQRHLRVLDDIGGILGAMKNIALMETHKLARFLAQQHRMLEGIEAAAADFLGHHPAFGCPSVGAGPGVIVAIGSQRGFCGDFNEQLIDAVRDHRQRAIDAAPAVLVVGRRLATKLGKQVPIHASFEGPSMAEEVQPVLHRLIDTLGELQARGGRTEPLAVTVFAHREAQDGIVARRIVPAPAAAGSRPHFAHPPLLNTAPSAFFAELVHHYLWAQLHDVFYGSLMAENRRRLRHMEGAMQRIDERGALLRRRFNVLRQEEITQEIEVIMLSNDALLSARGDAPRLA